MLAAYDLTLFAKLGGGDAAHVEPGYKFIRKLAADARSVYSSMATFESELSRGEVVAAPFYSAEITMQKRAGAPSIAFTVPKEGGLMLPYLLVLPAGAPRSAEALRFLEQVAACGVDPLEVREECQLSIG